MTNRSSRKARRPPRATSVTAPAADEGNVAIALGVLALAVATFVVYWPSLHGGLLWDDAFFVNIPEVRSVDGLRRIWLSPGAIDGNQSTAPFLVRLRSPAASLP